MSATVALPRHVAGHVDGRWVESPETTVIGNPATGEPVGPAPRGTVDMAVAAAAAARRAFPTWAATPLEERCRLLAALAAAIDARRDDLTALVVAETGALVPFARDVKVAFTRDRFAWHAGATPDWFEQRMEVGAADGARRHTAVLRHPAGVVACITPYNFQIPNVAAKLGAALVAGCTVILKPAPQDPLAAMVVFELIEEVGFPPGVANLVVSSTTST